MTPRQTLAIRAAVAALLVLGGYGLYELGVHRAMVASGTPATTTTATTTTAPAPLPRGAADGEDATRRHLQAGLRAGDTDPVTGRRILYYHDPMVPAQRFDRPAKSPFMDMMLVPVFAGTDGGGGGDDGTVAVSPRVQQNLGLRTAPVVEGALSPQVSAVGSIAYDERDQAVVTARATAFVERLHVRATLDAVVAGQPLADLHVPDWIAAQEEFLSLRRPPRADLDDLVDGARQRMRLLGMSDEQVALVERTGRVQPRVTLTAPIGGVVAELPVREGATVAAGGVLMRIAGLRTVWAHAEVPESQAALLRPGAKVRARSPAVPGATFDGTVQSLLPAVDPSTRTRQVRVALANPGGRLVPGMSVTMDFPDPRPEQALLVPTEAVIQTGRRTLVMVAEEGGRFRPVEVEAGAESDGRTAIRRGLRAGQRVVVSSQFLIDSEASLRGVEARTDGAGSRP